MYDSCIARQPIFDRNSALLGYEIRYRNTNEGRAALGESVVSDTFDTIRGGLPAFIHCGRSMLLGSTFATTDPKATILLLANELGPDAEVLEALERLTAAGAVLALDSLGEHSCPSEALAPLTAWVRINLHQDHPDTVGRICERVWHAKARFVGVNVLEQSQYDTAQQLGFDGFQGALFSRPEPIPAADLPASTAAAMRLLGLVRDPNVTDRALEAALATDAVLTFQLLRLVNSAAVGAKGVSSIGHALRIIGRSAFLRWLSLAVTSSRGARSGVDQELVRQAVERGRLLEQMSGRDRDPGTLFLVGLFSLMDAVFRMPLAEVVDRVALGEDVRAALLDRSGPYGRALALAEVYELGMFESAMQLASEMGVRAERLPEMYTTAVSWTAAALSAVAQRPSGARLAVR